MKSHIAATEIVLNNALSDLEKISALLTDFFSQERLEDGLKNQVNLVLEELFTNSVNYGFQGINNGFISIAIRKNAGHIEIIYRDNGLAYNPLLKEAPDLDATIEDRPIGGLGVFFIKAFTDDVQYAREDDCNVIRMTKRLH